MSIFQFGHQLVKILMRFLKVDYERLCAMSQRVEKISPQVGI